MKTWFIPVLSTLRSEIVVDATSANLALAQVGSASKRRFIVKRDMGLIRKMALVIEDSPSGYAPHGGLKIDGYTDEQIGYHAHLMVQAGLANGRDVTSRDSSSPEAMLTSLTWAGHEFSEAARDETRWKKAMGIVEEKGGSVTLSILTQLLTELMKRTFGLP